MKLSEYLPEVPQLAQQMTNLNSQIDMLQLMKAAGDTGQAPTIGLDHVVNTWVRHQMAYRQQLVMDLQTVAMSVEEIRGPLNHITSEVFRRGLNFVPLISLRITPIKLFKCSVGVSEKRLFSSIFCGLSKSCLIIW